MSIFFKPIKGNTGQAFGKGCLTQKIKVEIAAVSGRNVKLAFNGEETDWICKDYGDFVELSVNFELEGLHR